MEKLTNQYIISKAKKIKELHYTDSYFAARDAADLLQAEMEEHGNNTKEDIAIFEAYSGMCYRDMHYKGQAD